MTLTPQLRYLFCTLPETVFSSGPSECARCARVCKSGAPFSIYTLWVGPIFSLRAFKNLWDFLYDCIFVI